jgi:hypothetical protein
MYNVDAVQPKPQNNVVINNGNVTLEQTTLRATVQLTKKKKNTVKAGPNKEKNFSSSQKQYFVHFHINPLYGCPLILLPLSFTNLCIPQFMHPPCTGHMRINKPIQK